MVIILLVFSICYYVTNSALGVAPPKLNPLMFPDEHQEGMSVRVSCTAYAGDPPLHFQWLKDGAKIDPDLPATVRQLDDYTSSLTLGPLSESHVGNYTCIVNNDSGSNRTTARLFVKVAPKWITQPSDSTIQSGQQVALPCMASGSPKPEITWTKKGLTSPSYRWHTTDNGSLVLSQAEKEDSGIYTCLVTNGVGAPLEKTVHLSVWNRPQIKKKFFTESIEKGREIALICEAKGDQPLFFLWRKERRDISDFGQLVQRINREDDISTGNEGGSSKLFISNTQTTDSGTYTCIVQNDVGNDTMNVRLVVTERPQPPMDLEVSDFWSRNIRVRWSSPYSGSSAILHYIVEFWDVSDPAGIHKNVTVPSSITSTVLKNLTPATNYRLRLLAVNIVGVSPPSDQIQFKTAEEEPAAPPMDVQVDKTGATFVRVIWKPPSRKHWNGVLKGYYVGYKAIGSSSPYAFFTSTFSNKSSHYILRGLQKTTGYYVVVKAFNNVGTGPASREISFRTREGEAPAHPLLTILAIGSTSLQLRGTVTNDEFVITGFTVYCKAENGDDWQEKAIAKSENNIFLENLEPGVLYHVYIIAQSAFGDSEPSETVSIRTTSLQGNHEKEEIKQTDENAVLTQMLYIIIPVIAATIIIIAIVIAACLYVYYKKPPSLPVPYPNLQRDITLNYSSTLRRKDFTPPSHQVAYDCIDRGPHWSAAPSTKSMDSPSVEEEPIYECVMDEMRHVMMQHGQETLRKPVQNMLC